MKVLIEIDEDIMSAIKDYNVSPSQVDTICEQILNGTPLNGTNGEVLKAVFPNVEIMELHGQYNEDFVSYSLDGDSVFSTVYKSWWNAPYKAESEVTE